MAQDKARIWLDSGLVLGNLSKTLVLNVLFVQVRKHFRVKERAVRPLFLSWVNVHAQGHRSCGGLNPIPYTLHP